MISVLDVLYKNIARQLTINFLFNFVCHQQHTVELFSTLDLWNIPCHIILMYALNEHHIVKFRLTAFTKVVTLLPTPSLLSADLGCSRTL